MPVPLLPVDRRRTTPADRRRHAAAERRRTAPDDRRWHATEVRRRRAAYPVPVDIEALLDELVRELFALGLGIAGAVGQVEGPVADRLSAVLEDADRLVRTVRSASVRLKTERA